MIQDVFPPPVLFAFSARVLRHYAMGIRVFMSIYDKGSLGMALISS